MAEDNGIEVPAEDRRIVADLRKELGLDETEQTPEERRERRERELRYIKEKRK